MAKYQITSPSGDTYEITAPENATQDEILAYAQQQFSPKTTEPKKYNVTPEFIKKSSATMWRAENPVKAAIADVAGGMSDLTRMALTKAGFGDVAEKMYPQATTADTGYRLVGNLIDPTAYAVAGGATKLAQALPIASKIGQATIGGAVGGGLLGGTLSEDTVSGALGGAAIGGALPGTIALGQRYISQPVKRIASSLFGGTGESAQSRMLADVIGKENIPAVSQALRTAQPMIPGAPLTAGEASVSAKVPEMAALQEAIKGRDAAKYFAIKESQMASRAGAVTPSGDVANLQALRDKIALPIKDEAINAANAVQKAKSMYFSPAVSAGNKPLYANQIVAGIDEKLASPGFQASNQSALVKTIRDKIAGLADRNGIIDAEDLYTVRKEINQTVEQLLGATNPQVTKEYAAKVAASIKPVIDDAINASSDGKWSKYLTTYQKMSKPIDRANVMQVLHDALVAPVEGAAERANAFKTAMRNAPKTIQKATGFGGYEKLEDILTPSQMNRIKAVAADLDRQSQYKQLAKAGTEQTLRKIRGIESEIPKANVLSRILTLVNTVVKRAETGASEKTLDQLAISLQDPVYTAKLLDKATTAEKNAIKFLQRVNQTSPVVAGVTMKDEQQ